MFLQTIRSTRQGFSLTELIVAILIIGIMAGAAFSFFNWIGRAKRTRTEAHLKSLQLAISTFHTDTGVYPTSLNELVVRPSNSAIAKKWRGPYAEEREAGSEATDGWQQAWQYMINPKGASHPYTLFSWGAQGEGSPEEEHISVWDI